MNFLFQEFVFLRKLSYTPMKSNTYVYQKMTLLTDVWGIRRYKINVREKQKEGKIKLYVILVIFIALVYLKYSVSK